MKRSFKLSIASILASELLEYGMLWGNELEWFLKKSVDGYIKFNNDKEYLEFEDMVLNYIEIRYKKIVFVLDISQNKVGRYMSVNDIADELDVSKTAIYNALKNGTLVKRKYYIFYSNRDMIFIESGKNQMGILEIAEALREIAENKAKETGKTVQEVWEESVKELNRIYKENDEKYLD